MKHILKYVSNLPKPLQFDVIIVTLMAFMWATSSTHYMHILLTTDAVDGSPNPFILFIVSASGSVNLISLWVLKLKMKILLRANAFLNICILILLFINQVYSNYIVLGIVNILFSLSSIFTFTLIDKIDNRMKNTVNVAKYRGILNTTVAIATILGAIVGVFINDSDIYITLPIYLIIDTIALRYGLLLYLKFRKKG